MVRSRGELVSFYGLDAEIQVTGDFLHRLAFGEHFQNFTFARGQGGESRDPVVGTRGERAQIALLLGSIVAEGFVAVEAADKERIKEVGRGVLELSRAIGVEKTVLARTNLIVT